MRATEPSVVDDPAHGWVLIGGSSCLTPSVRRTVVLTARSCLRRRRRGRRADVAGYELA